MEAMIREPFDILQLRGMLDRAGTIDEIRALNALVPDLNPEEKAMAHRNLDDGIYDANGILVGELHPDD